MLTSRVPTPKDVAAAAKRLAGFVRRTPLIRETYLDRIVGGRLLFKAENLQITGSFKIRGAYNRLVQLTPPERRRGIVAWSAGNHGQALAFVGQRLNVPVTIVMPSDAPETKIRGTYRYGANVVFYDRKTQSREAIGQTIAQDTGAIIVPPFDDKDVIAGQGTTALEVFEDVSDLAINVDQMVVCVGGGGLIAGCALAGQYAGTTTRFFSAEPVGYDDTLRSLSYGARVKNEGSIPTCADALMTVTPGELTFALNQTLLAGGFAVADAQIAHAVSVALQELKLVVEPGGAVGLAAVIAEPESFRDRTTVVVLTGGNVDSAMLTRMVSLAQNAIA